MYTTFKATHDDLLAEVQQLVDTRFNSLDRVLSKRSEQAQLSIEVARETKQQTGRVFRASGHLVVAGETYHAEEWAETMELAIDRVRDELVREVRTSHGRAVRMLKKGGSALKSLLKFGRRS